MVWRGTKTGAVRAGDFKIIDFVNESRRSAVREVKNLTSASRDYWTYYVILTLVGVGKQE